jgi:hypothetical protein
MDVMSADAGRLRLNDALRVTSVGLRARPLRAALFALGIAIGTAAMEATARSPVAARPAAWVFGCGMSDLLIRVSD